MNGATWLVIGLVIGGVAGWVWTTWRLDRRLSEALDSLRAEQQQRQRELAVDLTTTRGQLAELQANELELREELSHSANRVAELLNETKEQTKELDRAEARVFDRESTIDSLRSKLYASRNTATDLENELETKTSELEILRERFNALRSARVGEDTADVDPLSSIVVDLGDTLSVERD
ncbi:MAG: hypothetical protein QNJ77_14210 [Acidimicrobiia bacterium]|nr:hypothetical protein [Acidimicrobiia bacterium]